MILSRFTFLIAISRRVSPVTFCTTSTRTLPPLPGYQTPWSSRQLPGLGFLSSSPKSKIHPSQFHWRERMKCKFLNLFRIVGTDWKYHIPCCMSVHVDWRILWPKYPVRRAWSQVIPEPEVLLNLKDIFFSRTPLSSKIIALELAPRTRSMLVLAQYGHWSNLLRIPWGRRYSSSRSSSVLYSCISLRFIHSTTRVFIDDRYYGITIYF